MSTSIWPSEYLKENNDIRRTDSNQLIVFLASPFNPENRYNDLHMFCQYVCTEIAQNRGIKIECHRGDTPPTPNVIHQDIWDYLQRSDAIIIDISEKNPNVMIELGVAMAIRDKNSVIVIQDIESEATPPFDISPARYLKYRRNISGDIVFLQNLKMALEFSLAPAPYIPENYSPKNLPFDIKISDSSSFKNLLSPANSHRRLLSEGLEFGSFNFFQYSWLTLGLDNYSDVRLIAKMKFSEIASDTKPNEGWMGIMFRSRHFFANYGHLIYVVKDGSITLTQPFDELGNYEDVHLGKIVGFNQDDWVKFDLCFDETSFSGLINNFQVNIETKKMPFRYNSGLIRFQTHRSRAILKSVHVEIPIKSSY